MALVQPWIDPEKASRLLSEFTGLPHRFASVRGPEGIGCINDSKATNVGSSLAALTGFKQDAKLILIAGGDSKDANLKPLGAAMRGRVKLLITLGQDAQKLNTVAGEHDIAWRQVNDMDQAVAVALAHAEAGDTVLLSPACASLDMYPNFAARGDDFAQCVAQHSAFLQPEKTS
jgi:UDP-N-acetylmuramoylalanine--D-glutamate ligase